LIRKQTNTGSWYRYDHGQLLDVIQSVNPFQDSPSAQAVTDIVSLSIADSFENYLEYNPGGGQWVPLSKVTWNWSGAGSFSGTNWSLTSSSNPTPSVSDTQDYPRWTNKWSNVPIIFIPE
jgi:hypothetical protein